MNTFTVQRVLFSADWKGQCHVERIGGKPLQPTLMQIETSGKLRELRLLQVVFKYVSIGAEICGPTEFVITSSNPITTSSNPITTTGLSIGSRCWGDCPPQTLLVGGGGAA